MDLDDEELKATRRMNGSDKNVGSIEKLIEELTKVRPDELSKDGLKLFGYINEIIDRNKELEEENKRLKPKIDVCNWQEKFCREIIDEKYVPVSSVKEKIEEYEEKAKRIAGTYQYADSGDDLENKKKQVIELRTKAEGLQEFLEGE